MESNTIEVLNDYSSEIIELDISNKNIIGPLDLFKFIKLKKNKLFQ